MWVHESFTNYSENLYVEYYYGKTAGSEYVLGTRKSIANDRPVVGIYDVNYEGSKDMYSKGGNMLHTLRQIINDDDKWLAILRGLNREFYHKVVKGSQIENYITEKSGLDLKPFFDQYLRDVRIPVFEYIIKDKEFSFRWNNCVSGFNMPVKVEVDGKSIILRPTEIYMTIQLKSGKAVVKIDPNWYVATLNISGN
jgi:aminopeptidase N